MSLRTIEKRTERIPIDVAVRKDTWWVKPLLTALGLGAFAVWATFRAFENNYFEVGSYLTPFYSPLIPVKWSINGWAVSPAFYILVFPLAFRATCYYYRQAYYRAFFWDPPACAIPESKGRKYAGERAFPLILQNIHRYALYFAVILLAFLWWDVLRAFWWDGAFSVRLGSLIMLVNILLLTNYTFGCHALRHLVGGKKDCFSCPLANGEMKVSGDYHAWKLVSKLNLNHMQWAWASLISVCLTDLYIRSVAAGVISDLRFF